MSNSPALVNSSLCVSTTLFPKGPCTLILIQGAYPWSMSMIKELGSTPYNSIFFKE